MKHFMICMLALVGAFAARAESMREFAERTKNLVHQKQENSGLNVDLSFAVAITQYRASATVPITQLEFDGDLSAESQTLIYNCLASQLDELRSLIQLAPDQVGDRIEVRVYLGTWDVLSLIQIQTANKPFEYRESMYGDLIHEGREEIPVNASEGELHSFAARLYASNLNLSSLRVRLNTWAGPECLISKAQAVKNSMMTMLKHWESMNKAEKKRRSDLELAWKAFRERLPISKTK